MAGGRDRRRDWYFRTRRRQRDLMIFPEEAVARSFVCAGTRRLHPRTR
jgi:hypothetical protein